MADGARLILASESPRRLQLLGQIGVTPDLIEAAAIAEIPKPRESPRSLALRLACEKAEAVAARHPDDTALILAADTVVARGRRVLPKPHERKEARECLDLLSGRSHSVLTGVALVDAGKRLHTRVAITRVTFKRLSLSELERYLDGGEWKGKAGGYAIQGAAAAFIKTVNGSYSNVVGLPLYEVAQLLEGCGYRVGKKPS